MCPVTDTFVSFASEPLNIFRLAVPVLRPTNLCISYCIRDKCCTYWDSHCTPVTWNFRTTNNFHGHFDSKIISRNYKRKFVKDSCFDLATAIFNYF